MADWTVLGTAFISGASALGGGALGYLAAQRQTEAETQRLRLTQSEEHLRHRQAVSTTFSIVPTVSIKRPDTSSHSRRPMIITPGRVNTNTTSRP
jgi:hypothetical protein